MRVAVVGATGAVGKEMIRTLERHNFPVDKLFLFASSRSDGKEIIFRNIPYKVVTLSKDSIKRNKVDVAFFSAGVSRSKEYAMYIVDMGGIVIDNSSAFRYDDNIPLIVPSINGNLAKNSRLISNPNCTTAILLVALYPIYKEFGIKKLIVSTYQATSGAGNAGITELLEESKNYLEGLPVKNNTFAHPIPFNIIPHIDVFQENDYTKEEMKVVWETHKILNDDSFPISCTAVRIPTLRAHSESIVLETEKNITNNGGIDKVKRILQNAQGVNLRDNIENNDYPMPLNASEIYEVQVGRIRKNLVFGDYGLEFFVSGDQLLRGAALNAVEIAEILKIKEN